MTDKALALFGEWHESLFGWDTYPYPCPHYDWEKKAFLACHTLMQTKIDEQQQLAVEAYDRVSAKLMSEQATNVHLQAKIDAVTERAEAAERDFIQGHKNCIAAREKVDEQAAEIERLKNELKFDNDAWGRDAERLKKTEKRAIEQAADIAKLIDSEKYAWKNTHILEAERQKQDAEIERLKRLYDSAAQVNS